MPNRQTAPGSVPLTEPIDHGALMLLGVSPFPFNDPAWGWEVKFDGFRILAFREGKQARLLTRNGNELGIALLGLDAILSFRFSNSLPLQARVV